MSQKQTKDKEDVLAINKFRLKMRMILTVQTYTESRKMMSGELSLVSVALVQ